MWKLMLEGAAVSLVVVAPELGAPRSGQGQLRLEVASMRRQMAGLTGQVKALQKQVKTLQKQVKGAQNETLMSWLVGD